MTDKKKILAKLFLSTLYLRTFTFGGGYVIVTLMKQKFVDELHWIQEDEMLDPLTKDSAYMKVIDRIFENIVGKKYYLTGGVGARHARCV